MSMSESNSAPTFTSLGLPKALLDTVTSIGYSTPSPIQTQAIPYLLQGRDLVGQAQTGTGKTAAFALPLLARIQVEKAQPQALILAPTRELAMQVAESLIRYGSQMPKLNVACLYGGAGFREQLQMLKRGSQIIVGTPGRVIDHIRRGSLSLASLATLILDEADEMLRMGFIEDVEWVLEHSPKERQIVLFSATMPDQVRSIAQRHLKNPEEIAIRARTATADTVRQRVWRVSGMPKLEALQRLLEVEPVDGAIIFVRTKAACDELADALQARGHAAAALHGDMAQPQRERVVEQLKSGQLNLLIATDVAARGLDVERISHVFNYDIPFDTEAYIHRIGRTGRAGRTGEAILFVTPREQRLLRGIERATGGRLETLLLPDAATLNAHRIARMQAKVRQVLDNTPELNTRLEPFTRIVDGLLDEGCDARDVAIVFARLFHGDTPFFAHDPKPRPERELGSRRRRSDEEAGERPRRRERARRDENMPMESYRIEVGRSHGVQPSNIVGAIANEAGLASRFIGRVKIHADYSTVDLPKGMPSEVFQALKKVRICGHQTGVTRQEGFAAGAGMRTEGRGRRRSSSAHA
ncbi:ATP-dependent RNA helicase DeaD [Allopseudospirillum japonicum]|uniref:ATP-dependent RNA helicase DeaD n=2 Tax=Allopseudospirillum japonicum TaxID=64971 RepID=A0A1H6QWS2_9GAMM|nr:ATP-dependent RNA helicase DeaD [Allopseudospirillum japonicum]